MVKDENIRTKLIKHYISLINIKLLNEWTLLSCCLRHKVRFVPYSIDSPRLDPGTVEQSKLFKSQDDLR